MGNPMAEPLSGVSEQTRQDLVAKCQENGWLKRGGYAWQDDPYLEEYPYSFVAAKDIQELSDYFACGNWALRQGIVYRDLAFVQQVDGGDEWWTLKQTDGGWMDFESISCGRIARRDPEEFANLVAAMRTATPGQCRLLEYLPGDEGGPSWADVLASRIVDISDAFLPYETQDGFDGLEAFRAHVAEVLERTPENIIARPDELAAKSDVPAAQALSDAIRKTTGEATADIKPLAERADEARFASENVDPGAGGEPLEHAEL